MSIGSRLGGLEQLDEQFEEMSDEDLVNMVKDYEKSLKFMELENKYLLKFLYKNEPEMKDMYDTYIKNLEKKAQKSQSGTSIKSSILPSMCSSKRFSVKSITSSDETQRKRNLSIFLKTELLISIMDDDQENYMKFKKETNKVLAEYRAEQEESKVSIEILEQTIPLFEQTVVRDGFDPLTQRINAEKFTRHMAESSKFNQSLIQKLILYINNEKLSLRKLLLLYTQREQLAENVQAVDFEQLVIENKNLNEKLHANIKNLKMMKEMNGWANLVRSNYKDYLQQMGKDIGLFKNLIDEQKERKENIDKDILKITKELEQAKSDYEDVKTLKETYEVPDTMDYVQIKSELYDKNSRLKVILRRKKILDIAMLACASQMKHIVGTKNVDPKWFKEIAKRDSLLQLNLQK